MKKVKLIKAITVLVLLLAVVASSTVAVIRVVQKAKTEPDKGEPIVNFVRAEDEHPYLIKTYADGSFCDKEFNIVTFTDTHLDGKEDSVGDAVAFTHIENTLKTEKPDLVVVCGDVALGAKSADAAHKLANLFQQYKTYWGLVLGNHDGENKNGASREELMAIYESYSYCVLSSAPDIYGYGNCIVNIKGANDKVIQSLIFIDSGDYLSESYCEEYNFQYKSGYDFIKYDQIDWYKSEMRAIADKNGAMPASIMFIHIPLVEYDIAYKNGVKGEDIIYGEKREDVCASPYNTGMFAAIKEVGSTKAVVSGHDHINDFCVEYQGVKLIYSQSSSYNSYYMRSHALYQSLYIMGVDIRFSDGHTRFIVGTDGGLTVVPVLNQDNFELFDGLTDEQRTASYIEATKPR